MSTPKVSIIIPICNVADYLASCLDSAVGQTMKEIEIICIDDMSTDGSREIILDYASRDERILPILYNINKSASQARKDGSLLAKGKYIMFMDADDRLELNACEELYQQMEIHDVDILQFGTFVEPEPHVRRQAIKWLEDFARPCGEKLEGKEVFEGCFVNKKYGFNLWNKIYKAELCKKAFLHVEDGSFPKAQDLYAFFIIAWFAKSYMGISTKYYHYYFGRGITGGSRHLTLAQFERHCAQSRVAEKLKQFLEQQEVWSQYKRIWRAIHIDLVSECLTILRTQIAAGDKFAALDIAIKAWGKINIGKVVIHRTIFLIPRKFHAKCCGYNEKYKK